MFLSESNTTLQFQKRAKNRGFYFAAGCVIIGVLVLVGWQFDQEFLKKIIPGLVSMNPVTAICFIIIGTIIFFVNKAETSKSAIYTARAFTLLIVIIGLSCMLTNLLGIEGGIDHAFFTEKLLDKVSNIRNRMAPNTAFNFIITGISIFLCSYKTEKKTKVAQYLILVVAFVALLSIIGYIYGARSFYGVLSYIPMAINTSFCFLLISCAVLLSTCDKGLMIEFTGNYVGSVLARKLIPAVIVIPIILGFIIVYGEKAGLYINQFGTALFTAANILIFAYLIKKLKTSLNTADIARTTAEQKLLEMNASLEEKTASLNLLNKELESFSYTISHDLKAPLRAIEGYSNILQQNHADALGEEGNHLAKVIIKNSKKMSQLINDLLEFSLVSKKEFKSTHCDMDLIVKKILEEQQDLLKIKKYEIKINELYPCSGDPKIIEQVWINLISNALKYSQKKEKPLIEIGSYKEKSDNIYFIKDNGVGFNMDYANKLFGVFQRLHTETEFEGTGIGLAIVHRIVTRLGGKVWAEAKEGEGATFYFSLCAEKR